LSLSIFHRRVITNLDGAVKFYGTVTKKGKTDTIRIGSYDLTLEEKNKILAVVINYNHLLEKFSIPPIVMEYHETREFLKKIIMLKSELQNGNKENREENKSIEDDLPF
jgi:cytochrome c peroxidase